MFSLHDYQGRVARLCDRITRRELLRIGAIGTGGVSLTHLLAAEAASRTPEDRAGLASDPTFGRAKNVIFLYLAGGPPQHETFDPKPNAPVEVRGPFNPISTNVPGIHFCELLPRTARMADKLAVVRSMATDDNIHSSSSYWVLTGYKYQGPNARTIQPTDRPYFGSLVKMLKPSGVLPSLSTVWLPDIMRLNENVTPAGQTGGFLGTRWDPERFVGDPSLADYRVEGFQTSGLSPLRLRKRQSLLQQLEGYFDRAERDGVMRLFSDYQTQAFDLISSGRARQAFAIQSEPEKTRRRYGRNRWGQCVLLARRLIEAGVRLVHVQWPREPGDNAVDNPLWDTHAQNADRLEDVLCPQFDVGFTALIDDLDQRGLLDETLVVAIGEFGRTPKINPKGGRDHWGPVFSFALAGAGIRGGQVYGASDQHGAYPAEDRVQPGDLTATLYHLLGVDYRRAFHDAQGREHRLTHGEPLWRLLGLTPATEQRTKSTGHVSRVPPFDEKLLLRNIDFASAASILPADASSRPKGWRATRWLTQSADHGFGVRSLTLANSVSKGIGIGLHQATPADLRALKKGDVALLAQEVRSPFAGQYTLRVHVQTAASSPRFYQQTIARHFACKLIFFQYLDREKKPLQRKELASLIISPSLAGDDAKSQVFELSKNFVNPTPGGNFSFGLGLGVAILLEKVTDQPFSDSLAARQTAYIAVNRVELEFNGKPRNDDVQV